MKILFEDFLASDSAFNSCKPYFGKMVICNISISISCFKDGYRHLEQPHAKAVYFWSNNPQVETRVKRTDRQPRAEKLLGDIYKPQIQPKLFPLKINTWKQILKPKFRFCLQFLGSLWSQLLEINVFETDWTLKWLSFTLKRQMIQNIWRDAVFTPEPIPRLGWRP
jgi:hypothetical protein